MRRRLRWWVHHLGPIVVGLLVVALAALWLGARPAQEELGSYLGQLVGAESVLLLAVGLVLVSTLPWVDVYFNGMDHAAIWHRRVAIAGLVLLVPHILMSHHHGGAPWSGDAGVIATVGLVTLAVWAVLPRWRDLSPRVVRSWVEPVLRHPLVQWLGRWVGNYEIWRQVHRVTGLFVAIALAHALGDGSPFDAAPVLRWSIIVPAVIGLAFYVWRELFARHGHGLRDYEVSGVEEVGGGVTEIALRPLGKPLVHRPGQFATLTLETKEGWRRHPFTIASGVGADEIRFAVKGLGDYTSRVTDLVRPGMPALVGGPHGRFQHSEGAERQVWVAGGVGVTPFLGWLRSIDGHPPVGTVDFFYSVADDAPYASEIAAICERTDKVRFHLHRTGEAGRLTADRIAEVVGGEVGDVSVFLCGPTPMLEALSEGMRELGVPRWRIHREYFNWR